MVGFRTRIIVLLCALLALYLVATGFNLTSDVLTLNPQLDAAENVAYAKQILSGDLEKGPFFRALFYPLVISPIFAIFGSYAISLIAIFGLALHVLNTWLTYSIAQKIWNAPDSSKLAAVIYLIYPVSLFYAVQLLDMTLAITLFLLALNSIFEKKQKPANGWIAGLWIGLCVATRPHFLPLAILLPFIALFTQSKGRKAVTIFAGLLLVLGIQGSLNFLHSGKFKVLPWQGSYNLWAANNSGANGLYFKQTIDVSDREAHQNPARAESRILFALDNPDKEPPFDVEDMNAHWRQQFVTHALTNPINIIQLWSWKAYAILNNWEQYNNLTFSYHKSRLSTLRWNPLSWGWLLMGAVFGWVSLLRIRPKLAWAMLLIAAAYCVSLILFYASARFRLPLVPLAIILIAGIPSGLLHIIEYNKSFLKVIFIIALTGVISFSRIGDIRSTETYVQDDLMMAGAYADDGNDLEAAKTSLKVLDRFPERSEARRILCFSYFNLQLASPDKADTLGSWDSMYPLVQVSSTSDPAYATVIAFYIWHSGEHEKARSIWSSISKRNPDLKLASLANKVSSTSSDTALTNLTGEENSILRLLR